MIITVVRLLQLGQTQLVPDEAYYWDWSRHHALGYYDQGPFIAYLIRLTVRLFGVNEFGVRVGVLLCSFGTVILAHGLSERRFSPAAGFLAVLFLGLSPLMEVGSIIATYDPPLVFFWTLTVVAIERALFSTADNARWWYLAGVAAGLGLLSKHTMLVIVPCLALFLAISSQHRFWLCRREPYLGFGITLLMYSGVLWWNAHHHWWTFGHLLFLTHNSKGSSIRGLGDYLGSQVLLVGPLLFIGVCAASARAVEWIRCSFAARTGDGDHHARIDEGGAECNLYLFCMGWPVFLLFLIYALKSKVQGNWAVCAWITPVILLAGALAAYVDDSVEQARRVAAFATWTSAIGLALTLVMVYPALGYRAGIHLKPDADLTNQAVGWIETARRVDAVRQEMRGPERHSVFIVGSGYQYPAQMAFYLPDHPRTYDMFLHYRLDMYAAYVDELKSRLGEDAVFINENQSEDGDLRREFAEVTWDPPFPIYRRPYYAVPIRTVYIARCRGYRLYTGTSLHVGG